MSQDHIRTIEHVRIAKVKYVPRTSAIRVYKSSPERWTMQVRGAETLANGGEGTSFIVASASMTIEDMVAFRDAMTALIDEAARR